MLTCHAGDNSIVQVDLRSTPPLDILHQPILVNQLKERHRPRHFLHTVEIDLYI